MQDTPADIRIESEIKPCCPYEKDMTDRNNEEMYYLALNKGYYRTIEEMPMH